MQNQAAKESTLPDSINPPILLDTRQASEYLFGTPDRYHTLEQLRYRHMGPRFKKLGRHIRYTPADLDSYLEKQTFNGSHEAASVTAAERAAAEKAKKKVARKSAR